MTLDSVWIGNPIVGLYYHGPYLGYTSSWERTGRVGCWVSINNLVRGGRLIFGFGFGFGEFTHQIADSLDSVRVFRQIPVFVFHIFL